MAQIPVGKFPELDPHKRNFLEAKIQRNQQHLMQKAEIAERRNLSNLNTMANRLNWYVENGRDVPAAEFSAFKKASKGTPLAGFAQQITAEQKAVAEFSRMSPVQMQSKVKELAASYGATPTKEQITHLAKVDKFVQNSIQQGIARTNPVLATQRNKEAKRTRHLTDAEWTAIRDAADEALKTIMDVSFLTAQRIGDVLKIRLADIRASGHLYVKQEKTGKELLIEITPELRAALDNAKAKGGVRSLYLFSQANGKPWTYWAVRDKWRAAATAAGIEDTRLHDNRSKGITEANRQGLDAQLLAGHSSQKQTDSYIRDREISVAKPPSFRKKA
ncbi:MAG: tyrosine-type recombinase/integrase [Sulfuritalea sp.]|nr:tyrosine-type recombinase/integrase [Sulfuritalea sp.]